MNTVKDLRRTLSEEVRRLQPPAGLESRVLQQTFSGSVAANRPGARRRRDVRSRQSQSVEAPRLMVLVAAVLAVAIILSLVLAARALHLMGPIPAGHAVVGQATVISRIDFQCSLPVMVDVYPRAAAQVRLPGGMVVNESIEPADGNQTSTYDLQVGRWLPVLRSAISLDGRTWGYGTGMLDASGRNGTVHVVDAVTGKDRQLWSGAGGARVIGFLTTGIYFVETAPTGAARLWVVDPNRAGSAHVIGDMPANVVWDASTVFGALGGFARVYGSNGYVSGVERMDLNGAVTTWFTSPVGQAAISLLGLDGQGDPIISMGQTNERVLLLTGPGQSIEIANGSNALFAPIAASGDPHGVWFSEPGSIWLYQAGAGVREVVAMPSSLFPTLPPKVVPGLPSPSPGSQPTGPSGVGLHVIGSCQ